MTAKQFVPQLIAIVAVFAAGSAFAQGPRVSLEVVTEPGLPQEVIREWLPMLEKVGFSGVRVRGGQASDGAGLKANGTGANLSYEVTGVLTSDNRLRLPNGNFGPGSSANIKKWLEKLQAGGEEGLNAKSGAFGLVPKELVAVHEDLAKKLNFTTAGKTTKEVVQGIAAVVDLKLTVDPAVRGQFGDEKVADELIGMSAGTALAAAIRPLGLVMTPIKVGNDVQLRVVDSQAAKQVWPVGWPSKSNPKETLPDFFKFLNVEVVDRPIAEPLEAIRGRLNVPMIIDQNNLAKQQIDMATTKVSLPRMNTYYKSILEKLLFQAKLKCELRVDEADRPFLWITTLKQ
ncbi:hypothetical protein [Anatilimnocola floriformis]|uniref:hypothetical protein n=1 Tax=Anatilimnocola floriformis TaxID=2948575 RepID=UPI0020C5ADF5|nr:hypothetical protein [Anatilimnocola floriformis]